MNNVPAEKRNWKKAQTKVADYFKGHHFGVQDEKLLKSGRRIDIVALRKTPDRFLHVLVEVKDWNTVTRSNETEFCKQIIKYIVEYSLEDAKKPSQKDRWHHNTNKSKDLFIGILCLTKDVHFSFRKISQHFITKNEHILGIPFREQISENIKLYVARFDFLSKIFDDIGYPLYRETTLSEWTTDSSKNETSL